MSAADTDSLLRVATAWTTETAAIKAQRAMVIANFHKKFSGGVARKGMDTSPPAELKTLQAQLDSVTLRYRDLFHASMQDTQFRFIQLQVRETFGGLLNSDTAASGVGKGAEVTR